MEAFLKAISSVVPFLQPYPMWVKVSVVVTIMSAAVSLAGLVITSPMAQAGQQKPSKPKAAWLTIEAVHLFGMAGDVRVTADVNGVKYVYPSKSGIDWLEVGPTMSGQTFDIPIDDSYVVSFAMETSKGNTYGSVETLRVNGTTDGSVTYRLHPIVNKMRGAAAPAEVVFRIDQQ